MAVGRVLELPPVGIRTTDHIPTPTQHATSWVPPSHSRCHGHPPPLGSLRVAMLSDLVSQPHSSHQQHPLHMQMHPAPRTVPPRHRLLAQPRSIQRCWLTALPLLVPSHVPPATIGTTCVPATQSSPLLCCSLRPPTMRQHQTWLLKDQLPRPLTRSPAPGRKHLTLSPIHCCCCC